MSGVGANHYNAWDAVPPKLGDRAVGGTECSEQRGGSRDDCDNQGRDVKISTLKPSGSTKSRQLVKIRKIQEQNPLFSSLPVVKRECFFKSKCKRVN